MAGILKSMTWCNGGAMEVHSNSWHFEKHDLVQ
jgi:hypothetical protein